MDDLKTFFNSVIFELGSNKIELRQIIFSIVVIALVMAGYGFLNRIFLQKIIDREYNVSGQRPILRRWVLLFVLIGVALVIKILSFDFQIIEIGTTVISLQIFLLFLIILSFSSLVDWIFIYVLQKQELNAGYDYHRRSMTEFSPGTNIQSIILAIALIVVLKSLNWDIKLFSFTQGKEEVDFNISRIISAILILLIARFIVWMFKRIVLGRYYAIKKVDPSTQYAINQLLTYILFVIAVFIALENLGLQMTLLWGGAAALLVGIGLGLQQTFNDLISGIILLFERTVEVGAVVQIDGEVGRVRKIGLRTSIVETRDNQAIIVPNSKLIVDIVRNWNHNDDKVRFTVKVGVAYGSDTEIVKELLIKCALEHPRVLHEPSPFVRFLNFGDSSLEMELHFWSNDLMPIENIKSDIRFAIDKVFREKGITIPFPQRDLWIRNTLNINDIENKHPE
jgi:small-conductance mechanosensitive channel